MQTDEPASEGTALLEPFIDTVIILSLSSLVILTSAIPNGLMGSGIAGIELTSAACGSLRIRALYHRRRRPAVCFFELAGLVPTA